MNPHASGSTDNKSRWPFAVLAGGVAEVTSTARRCERRVLPFDFPRVDAAASRLVLFAALFLLILSAMGVGRWRRMMNEVRSELVGVEARP